MHDLTAIHTLVLNALEEQIAVIDRAGIIVDVNFAWTNFGLENGLSSSCASVGSNYLKVLSVAVTNGDSLAGEAAQGIVEVVSGTRASFHLEYPCHSPDEKRWFMMRVTRPKDDSRNIVVISHQNITLRKLAEERAEHLAMHDPLTGLANRRYFDMFANQELRRTIRNGSPISLIALDVDFFKEYNDELGHLLGDQCLINVSQALLAFSHRPSDLAVRLGGDEFALLLGDTDVAESLNIAESVQKTINELKMYFGESRQVTISMGIATAIHREHQYEDFLLREADKALYRAKRAGRNRTVHAQLADDEQA